MRGANDREEFVSRTLKLPTYLWRSIDAEAAQDHAGDISTAVVDLFDRASIFRAMIDIRPARRRGNARQS